MSDVGSGDQAELQRLKAQPKAGWAFTKAAADKRRKEQLDRAQALLKLAHGTTFSKDPVFALAIWTMYKELPADVRSEAEQPLDRPKSGGRREGLNQLQPDAQPFVVKVSIAGSGYGMWKTHVSKGADGKELDWTRQDDQKDLSEVTHYTRDKEKGPELMFAGPGGAGTKNSSVFGGASDSGSNSIANLVQQIPPLVKKTIEDGLKDSARPILILIKAHSRGAVAGSQVAEALRKEYPEGKVELVLIDPVPGPGQSGANLEMSLPDLDEFTLVYSVSSGYSAGFTPQKVMGAHRVIISRQNHSVGLDKGFQYEGKQYKGSGLNSLPKGVYVDLNADGENTFPLVRVANMESAQNTIQEALKANSSRYNDTGRKEIIEKVLKDYLDKAQ